jgi:RimJ/RimL family protein N-acetyltransferase
MFLPLITTRLILKRLEQSDAEKVHSYRTDGEVGRFQDWPLDSDEEVRSFIARLQEIDPITPGEWFQIGITLRESGELIGDCGLHARADDRRQVEVGITLTPCAQGRGLAAEAFAALLDFLFRQTETHRVFCSVDPQNQRCLKLIERMGMRREAHMKESLWFKGAWADEVVFAILRKEWHERGKKSQLCDRANGRMDPVS